MIWYQILACSLEYLTVVVYHVFTKMKVEFLQLFIIYDNISQNFPCTHSKNNPPM